MALTDKEVKHVARLARLAMTEEELHKYRDQLGRILDFVEKLGQYDVSGISPTSHVVPLQAHLREDVPAPWPDREGILANAPEREDVYFKVKKVIE